VRHLALNRSCSPETIGIVRLRWIELPTLLVALGIYGAWLGLTLVAGRGAMWAWPALAVTLALHMSLQHEHIHGHPTRSEAFNAWLAGCPLSLWLPYTVYRRTHRAHHASAALTDPAADVESFYVDALAWSRMGRGRRALHLAHQTLLGRLLLGPAVVAIRTAADEAGRLCRLDRAERRGEALGLLAHLAGVACVVCWLLACDVSLLAYAGFAVYPGLSLTLLRSYAEHHPHPVPDLRTAVVESRVVGWLFLHNNLHVVHHEAPELPWYRLTQRWRRDRAHHRARGVKVIRGYWSLLPHLLRAKDSPVHPSTHAGGEP
jgi:fatty acid desaturase